MIGRQSLKLKLFNFNMKTGFMPLRMACMDFDNDNRTGSESYELSLAVCVDGSCIDVIIQNQLSVSHNSKLRLDVARHYLINEFYEYDEEIEKEFIRCGDEYSVNEVEFIYSLSKIEGVVNDR